MRRAGPGACGPPLTASSSSPPEMIDILEREWAPLASANKFGKGDGTGRIPDEAMAIASASLASLFRLTLPDGLARTQGTTSSAARTSFQIDKKVSCGSTRRLVRFF